MKYLATALLLAATSVHAQSWGPAKWVWDQPDANKSTQTNNPRYLRQSFELSKIPEKAELWVTCDNVFTAYLNGKKIGGHSEWKDVKKYDVAKSLVVGRNVLALEAVNQGGSAGIIARLQLQSKDDKEKYVVTDGRTLVTQKAGADWFKVEFDDKAWTFAAELGDASISPWNLEGTAKTKTKTASARNAPAGAFDFPAVDPKVKDRQKAKDQIKNFIVPEGFEVELVAADPLIINPVSMTLDSQGRIVVSESHTYRYGPNGSPIKPFSNPVVRLDPEGDGLKRTLVTEGFDDPAMGLAIKNDQLWLTANNYLYTFKLGADGKATDKKTIVTDLNKAWNPFGMFVIEWGMDNKLYMSVGNHAMDLRGPEKTKMAGKGSSGIVVRMEPDGSKMERLVHGLRVPYSFEMDPFGQLWLLSNGEGNPNRFVRVIDGVDYHCYTRTNDVAWLTGNDPLAPPCFELHRGADTQLMRYFGSAYPDSYQGSLFVCNWGGHGFPGLNRGIFRFVPDDRNNIVKKEPFVLCSDPYFRPSHIALDAEGNLLIADWYGRDDESDLTGRIWRVKYKGKDKAKTDASLEEVRKLWAQFNLGGEKRDQIASWATNADWRIRKLTMNLMRRYNLKGVEDVAKKLATDSDPAVRLEAALSMSTSEAIRAGLLDALKFGASKDAHLRYEAAWHLAKHGDSISIAELLKSDDESLRLAGLIAIDVACYEGFDSKKPALAALGQAIESPGKLDLDLTLKVAQLNGDGSLAPAFAKFVKRTDLSPAITAKAILVMKSKVGGLSKELGASVGKSFLDGVSKGTITLSTPNDQLTFLEFLEFDGPTPSAIKHLSQVLRTASPTVRPAALALARRFGKECNSLAEDCWRGVFTPNHKLEERADFLATVVAIETKPSLPQWEKVLDSDQPMLVQDAVRWWRSFKDDSAMKQALSSRLPSLVKKHPVLLEDLEPIVRHLEIKIDSIKLPVQEKDKDVLGKSALAVIGKLSKEEKQERAMLGKQVFERSACVKCHTAVTQNTPLAPSLKGIAAQKIDYLVESVLYPSKIIKTGFETEVIVTKNGQTLSGLVKEEGEFLRVLNLDKDVKIAKKEVDERSVQKISIMPEGQEAVLSRREFVDLIVYLATLK